MREPAPLAERKTPPVPIPLTVLTGFLGAGKTTLLNRLLKDPALAETAVIVNEFSGELFEAFLGAAAPDQPDRAALTDNPLVPFGGR